jgi:hypothetical protein
VQRRFIDRDPCDRVRFVGAGDGVADLEVADALDGAQVADLDDFGRYAAEVLEPVDLLRRGRDRWTPSAWQMVTAWPELIAPAKTRPIAMRPDVGLE